MNVRNFNETLTNDVVGFERLGPVVFHLALPPGDISCITFLERKVYIIVNTVNRA